MPLTLCRSDWTLLEVATLLWSIGFASLSLWHFVRERRLLQRFGKNYIQNEGWMLPLLGNAVNFILRRPWDLLMEWHFAFDTPLLAFTLLGTTMLSVASPELIKIVLQSQTKSLKKDVYNTMKPFLVILGNGIVTSEGESWMKQRLKMSHPLRHDVLQMIPQQTLRAVQRLMQKMDQAAKEHTPVPMGASLRHLTLQVISGTFFSLSAEESDTSFATFYLPIVDEANTRVWHPYRAYLFVLPAFWRHRYYVHRLNAYVSHLVQQRWTLRRQEDQLPNKQRPEDILDQMMQVYEQECGTSHTRLPFYVVRQFRDELKTFMLAGHETSAAMMTWCIYELMNQSKLTQTLVDEATEVFSKDIDWAHAAEDELPTLEVLQKLVWSDASLREALRKYSVVPIVARRTTHDIVTTEYGVLPANASVMINVQAVHLNPKYWPEPMKFDPSRFIGKTPEPFTFLAFSAGPRNCLGQYLALLESKMVISWLVQRYRFTLPTDKYVFSQDWSGEQDPRHRFMVPVIPKEELLVYVERM